MVNEALAAGLQVIVSDSCGVAPSVAGMAGVRVVDRDLTGLPDALRDAARTWRGPIRDPEILQHTPEAFAAVLDSTFRALLAVRSARGRRRPGPTSE